MKESQVNKLFSDDLKLIIATATIVGSIIGSFFTLKGEVAVLSEKLDNNLTILHDQQNQLQQITVGNSTRDSQIAALEAIIKFK